MATNGDGEYSLGEILKVLAQGAFHEDATQAFKALVSAMTDVSANSGGIAKGSMVLTLKFRMDRSVMEIDPTYKVTTPSTPRARTMLYPDNRGNLHRNDFRQHRLPGMDEPPVRDVAAPEERTLAEEAPRPVRDVIDFRARSANDV